MNKIPILKVIRGRHTVDDSVKLGRPRKGQPRPPRDFIACGPGSVKPQCFKREDGGCHLIGADLETITVLDRDQVKAILAAFA